MNLLAEAYAPDRLGLRWGAPGAAYATGYHRGRDVRKQNPARTASVVTDVVAIHAGTVFYVGRPNSQLGLTIGIDRGKGVTGRYEFHSHCADPSVGKHSTTRPGDGIARNASLDERPGLITGVHDHIVISDYPDGAWNTARPTYDPDPFIQAALAAGPHPAGGDSRPFPTPTPEEDEPMFKIYSCGASYMIIGPETFLELGDALTKKTGVDGTETLALYRNLGAPEIKLTRRDFDVLRINTRASQ